MMKQDYLKECLSEVSAKLRKAVPMDGFQREYCTYCQNKECGRSGASNLSFDRRTTNWYQDLFVNVPSAVDGDESAAKIASIWLPSSFVKPPSSLEVTLSEDIHSPGMTENTSESEKDASPIDESKTTGILSDPIELSSSPTQLDLFSSPIRKASPAIDRPIFTHAVVPEIAQTSTTDKQVVVTEAESKPVEQTTVPPTGSRPAVRKIVNTPFDAAAFVGEKPNDVILDNGGTFTFGDD